MHPDILATPTIAAIGPICTDERAFCDLVNGAASGTVITYHVGHLAYDRTLSAKVLDEVRRRRLNAVANRALRLAQGMGRVMPREWSCVCRPENCRPVCEARRPALILMISTPSARR